MTYTFTPYINDGLDGEAYKCWTSYLGFTSQINALTFRKYECKWFMNYVAVIGRILCFEYENVYSEGTKMSMRFNTKNEQDEVGVYKGRTIRPYVHRYKKLECERRI